MIKKRKKRENKLRWWTLEARIDDHLAAHRQYERIKREQGEEAADAAAKRCGWRLPEERES